jgi:hypothetical protein
MIKFRISLTSLLLPTSPRLFSLLDLYINLSMESDDEYDFTKQALDMVFDNKELKRKVYPVIYSAIFFNILVIVLLVYIIFKLHRK